MRTKWKWALAFMANLVGAASSSRPPTQLQTKWSAQSSRISPRAPGADALLLVNGFGGTPTMELYLMVNSALRALRRKGVRGVALSHWQLRNIARDGGLLDHGQSARRGAAEPVGRAGAHGGVALGDLSGTKPIRSRYVSGSGKCCPVAQNIARCAVRPACSPSVRSASRLRAFAKNAQTNAAAVLAISTRRLASGGHWPH